MGVCGGGVGWLCGTSPGRSCLGVGSGSVHTKPPRDWVYTSLLFYLELSRRSFLATGAYYGTVWLERRPSTPGNISVFLVTITLSRYKELTPC